MESNKVLYIDHSYSTYLQVISQILLSEFRAVSKLFYGNFKISKS